MGWTTNQIGYKPATGDTNYGTSFNASMDRIDAILGTGVINVKGFYGGGSWQIADGNDTANDLAVFEIIAALTGNTQVVIPPGTTIRLEIGAGETLTLPDHLDIIIGQGAQIHVVSGELMIYGDVDCRGNGPHFNIDSGSILTLNGTLRSHPLANIYSGSGTILFSRGPELCTNGTFLTGTTGWTLTSPWVWDETNHAIHFPTGTKTSTAKYNMTPTAGMVYAIRFTVLACSGIYGFQTQIGTGSGSSAIRNCCNFIDMFQSAVNTSNGFQFLPLGSATSTTDCLITNVSIRQYLGGRITGSSAYNVNGLAADNANSSADANTTAINQAINMVSGRGGGEVQLPPGLFKVSSPIFLRPGTTLKGEAMLSKLIATSTFTGKAVLELGVSGYGNNMLTFLAEQLTIDTSAGDSSLMGYWPGREGTKLGLRKMSFYGGTGQTAILSTKEYYDFSSTDIQQANRNSNVYQDIYIYNYSSASGAVIFEVSTDHQDITLERFYFYGTKLSLSFGGSRSLIQECYFNPVTSALQSNGSGGLYPRVLFTAGLNTMRDCYSDAASGEVEVWSAISLTTTRPYSSPVDVAAVVLDGIRNPATLIYTTATSFAATRASATQFTATGNVVSDGTFHLSSKPYLWVSDGTNMKRVLVSAAVYSDPTSTVDITGTLPTGSDLTVWPQVIGSGGVGIHPFITDGQSGFQKAYFDALVIGRGGTNPYDRTGTQIVQSVMGSTTIAGGTKLTHATLTTSFTIVLDYPLLNYWGANTIKSLIITPPGEMDMTNRTFTATLEADLTTVTVYLTNNNVTDWTYAGTWSCLAIVGT